MRAYDLAHGDPRKLAFDLTCMRVHDRACQMRLGLLLQQIPEQKDEFGIARILNILKMIYEDH